MNRADIENEYKACVAKVIANPTMDNTMQKCMANYEAAIKALGETNAPNALQLTEQLYGATARNFGERYNSLNSGGSASGARPLTEAEKEALKQKSAAAAAPPATSTSSYIVLGIVALVVFGGIYWFTKKK